MPPNLTAAVETYFADLRRVHASGGATGELSSYGPLSTLLNTVGGMLKPKVFCIGQLSDQGAGHPDFGLYVANQVRSGRRRPGQIPERGVVEVKGVEDDARITSDSDQVRRYLGRYQLVLVTNTRDFVLVGKDEEACPVKLESFCLDEDAEQFVRRLDRPRTYAREVGSGLVEYLSRALSHQAALAEPKDLAWLLASYARDGLARVEAAGDTPALNTVREALEEALGVHFEGEKGTRFFHSTLVQTLFYGIFSAWVLWSRRLRNSAPLFADSDNTTRFRWREAVWHLRTPVLQALFQQLSQPSHLQPLDLVEVLDWTGSALNRVDRSTFFSRLKEGEAVPYFYEPFLAEFDPKLRKQLGVWYTPREVVRYMVARVDRALKDDLGITEGLAAENVYVLDPCCGTGAYLAEVLRRINANLKDQGLGALRGSRVKQAATERVFGFEIMPAPFVVAHLQVGLTMQDLDAPIADSGTERAGIFLTNALTGWESGEERPLPFRELEEERDRAAKVKRESPILVVLGNPPYDGFAGMAVDEERALSNAYRTTRRVRRPEGHGLNDPYVRFFRVAERRIVQRTGRGVVCFISNYSWLDGLSFTGMRERYLEAFDTIRIDNLHGDRIISEYAPDGRTSETIFAIRGKSPGIKVGTSVVLLSRSGTTRDSVKGESIQYRDFHQAKAHERRQAMLDSLNAPENNSGYLELNPSLRLGLPFKPTSVSEEWFEWPKLVDLFPKSFPGVKTSRDTFLVDVDLDRLQTRIDDYFDADLSHDEIERSYPRIMAPAARFDAQAVRNTLLRRGGPDEAGFIRFAYRPFDTRWLYWEKDTKLLDEKRAKYKSHVFEGNFWMVFQNKARPDLSPPLTISDIGDLNQMNSSVYCVPAYLADGHHGEGDNRVPLRPNLSNTARFYLERLGLNAMDLFHHALAVLHDPTYNQLNADTLRAEGPRIPLPGWPNGTAEGTAEAFVRSADRGRDLATLLDPETAVPGITKVPLRPDIATIAVPATTDGRSMTRDDFTLEAGWGHFGPGNAVMAGQGRAVERPYTLAERAALGEARSTLGKVTFDILLNGHAFWSNVPAAVWNYKLGGYQVLKKWLSYREHAILGWPLSPEEVQYFAHTARRIAAILLTISSNNFSVAESSAR